VPSASGAAGVTVGVTVGGVGRGVATGVSTTTASPNISTNELKCVTFAVTVRLVASTVVKSSS
jgi:hypothetical protein